MHRIQIFTLLTLVLVASNCAFAQESNEIKIPSCQFEFGKVEVISGKFVVTKNEFRNETRTKTVQVTEEYLEKTPDNKVETKQRTVDKTIQYVVCIPVTIKFEVADADISFSTIAGKKVNDLGAVRKLLAKKERPAAIVYGEELIDPALGNFLNQDKVIVVHLKRPQPVPAKQVPAPAPVKG